jgi:hypothetical protein
MAKQYIFKINNNTRSFGNSIVRRRHGEQKRGRATEMDATVQDNLNSTAPRAVQTFREALGLKESKNKNRLLECTSPFTALLLLLLLLLLLFTANEFSLGGSSPYTSNKQE